MILQLLSKDATNFDRTIRRVLNDAEVRNVKDILDNINKKVAFMFYYHNCSITRL
jgi:tetrahydromethanopterin S-methyltransferase subunit G